MFDTFSIFWCTAFSSFCWVAGFLNSSFFLLWIVGIFHRRRSFGQFLRNLELCSKVLIFLRFWKFLERKLGISVILLSWRWWLTVGDQVSYELSCWRPAFKMAALSYFSRLWPNTVSHPPSSTKYGDPSKSVKIWRGCAFREAIKSKSENGGGVTNRKASFYQFEAWQRNFEASKCAISTLLPLSNNYPFKR